VQTESARCWPGAAVAIGPLDGGCLPRDLACACCHARQPCARRRAGRSRRIRGAATSKRSGGPPVAAAADDCRRRALHAHVEPVPGIQIIEHVETHGEALFRAIIDGDHEGIVAKRVDAPYLAGPNNGWLKVENRAYSPRAAVEWKPR